jgi:endothelin-converting enzyme
VQTVDGELGWILGRFYIEKAFSEAAKAFGDRIIYDIKDQFARRLRELTWFDKEATELAIQKVYNIDQKIGYPDKTPNITSPESLHKYYADVKVTPTTYFDNSISVTKDEVRKSWAKLGRPTNRFEWDMTPPTVNAYYNPPGNEIVFPAGIMQFPIFSLDVPEYISYGAFASIAGHELSHAFDSTGRHYDINGNLTDWWPQKTVEEFETRAQCFVDQYSAFSIEGPNGERVHVNGKLTLGENIADAGGVNAGFKAWKRRDAENPNPVLPGVQEKFTKEQLFFVSYGRAWCSKIRKEAAIDRVRTDPHSPAFARVLGTVSNAPAFLEAFNCPTRKPTCELW